MTTTSENPYSLGCEWKWLECCQEQAIDGHHPDCLVAGGRDG